MAARADDQYDAGEREVIDRILSERYNLSPDACGGPAREGEAVEAEAIDVFQFTRAIKQRRSCWRKAHRRSLEALVESGAGRYTWIRDLHEDALMRELAERLGLSPMESAQARQRVRGG